MPFWELLATLDDDDRDFVVRIYNEYADKMYSYAFKMLNNQADAEDAVGEIMYTIVKYISKFDGKSRAEVYNQIVIFMRAIIKNTTINAYNKRKRRVSREVSVSEGYEDERFDIELLDTTFDVTDVVISNETRECVKNGVLTLSEDTRDTINLVYVCGYSCVEAADILKISPSAVRARLFKARQKLKTVLEERM
jgi:RNA polymerase sigma-70 factor (ECF subfamily)